MKRPPPQQNNNFNLSNFKYQVIYIDPPYNTEAALKDGNYGSSSYLNNNEKRINKFIYHDKFSRNGWLNMLNERLVLAKQLLSEDGMIFVSIDDSEHAYLKVLMDEIFGEENFICNLIWNKKNSGSGSDSKYIRILHEYVLFYAKNISQITTNTKISDVENDKGYKYQDEYIKTRGKYKLKQLDFGSLTWNKKLDYVIEHDGKKYYPGGIGIEAEDAWKKRHKSNPTKSWCWRWSEEKFAWGLKNNFIVFNKDKIYTKQYQYVDENNIPIVRIEKFNNFIFNDFNNLKNIHGSNGTNERNSLFGEQNVFDHPKPTTLIKFLINFHPNKNARVLDFFAGSGTTGHAVLDLNRKDDGKRTFTLITNNENNIGFQITYERLYRIIYGQGSNGEKFEWTKINKPYLNEKLKVFEIKYENISLSNDNFKILDLIKNWLDSEIPKYKFQESELLTKILNLYPRIKN